MFFPAGGKAAVHLRDWLSGQSQSLLEVLGCGPGDLCDKRDGEDLALLFFHSWH